MFLLAYCFSEVPLNYTFLLSDKDKNVHKSCNRLIEDFYLQIVINPN